MRILNLYSGIGGNRKNWGNFYEITAVENNKNIAKIYQDFFPDDKMIVADAHQYLLDHYKEYNFIWSSPPCPSHSRVRKATEYQNKPIFPDMKLYEEILFLQGYFKGKFVVENVISWYEPLIRPHNLSNHFFWTNFVITPLFNSKSRKHNGKVNELQDRKGLDISKYSGVDKRKILRNCVEPETGKHILDCAFGIQKQKLLF